MQLGKSKETMSLSEFQKRSFSNSRSDEKWDVPASKVRELSQSQSPPKTFPPRRTEKGVKNEGKNKNSERIEGKNEGRTETDVPAKDIKKEKTRQKLEELQKQTSWNVVGKKVTKAKLRRPDPEDSSRTVTLDEETPKASKIVVLKNLPKDGVTERDLKNFFKKVGTVNNVNVLRNEDKTCKGIAFIEFDSIDDSSKALGLNKFWYEDRKVYVSYAKARK